MEPVTLAIVGTITFGVITALSVFVRQLFLSRDKQLNDKAHKRALAQEAKALEKIRHEMQSNKRFDSHYQVLGDNKDAIQYIDQKIESILNKKFELIERYSKISLKESSEVIDGTQAPGHKSVCDLLRQEMDSEMQFYEDELKQLQEQRTRLWDSHAEMQDYLLEQEKNRNLKLAQVYHRHSSMLEKIYQRHHQSADVVTNKTLEAGTQSFNLLTSSFHFLLQFFGLSSGLSAKKVQDEILFRNKISEIEQTLNEETDEKQMDLKEAEWIDNIVSDPVT